MNDDKIIPFKPRPRVPSEQEIEAFLHATRNWPPQLRELLLPEHMKRARELPRG
jgi:hypothetical protein